MIKQRLTIAIFFLVVISFILWLSGANFRSLYYRAYLEISPEKALLDLTREVHGLIKYGQCPAYLERDEILSRGFGHCGTYATLLESRLDDLSLYYSRIGSNATTGAKHTVIEVEWRGKRFVVDPTLGVVYPEAYTELVRHPSLADVYFGEIPQDISIYGGSQFFGHIATFKRERQDRDLFSVPQEFVHASLQGNTLEIEWPSGLDARAVELTLARNAMVSADFWDKPIFVPYLDVNSIVVPESSDNKLRLNLAATKVKDIKDVSVAVKAVKKNATSVLPVATPLATFVGFEGGHALIDSLALMGEQKTYYFVDIGTPKNESSSTSMVYSSEALGRQSNTWGKPVKVDEVTYRPADQSINSEYGHAVVSFAPDIRGIRAEKAFRVNVCYVNPSDSSGITKLKFYNLKSQIYEVLGELAVSPKRRCQDFAVGAETVWTMLGDEASK